MNIVNRLKRVKSYIGPKAQDTSNWINDIKNLFGAKELKTIFDVGAHEGNISRQIGKQFPEAMIYAFEPFPNSYKKLESLVKSTENIKAYPLALSSSTGKTQLFVNKSSETNSLFPSRKLNSTIDSLTHNLSDIEIQSSTLDSFCEEMGINAIDLMKIDTQGSELMILEGSRSLLQKQAVTAIYCEVEFIEIYEKQPLFDEIFQYLKGYGYLLHNLYNLNHLETGQLAWADALFISEKHYKNISR